MRRTILAFILALICVLSTVAPARAQAPNTITTIAGGGAQQSAATSAYLPQPYAGVRDKLGNTYISVPTLNTVYKVDTTGTLSVYAGTGIFGFSGDGGPATQAQLDGPTGLAVDRNGNLFIADTNNERIRRVDTSGNITTVAGSEDPFFGAFAGDDGPATSARLSLSTFRGNPNGVAVDASGNLFIADAGNKVVRRVDAVTQIITTYAGGSATPGCPTGPATGAGFTQPAGVAVDGNGNLFISDADPFGNIVCKVDASQAITTYAGQVGKSGFPGTGDGGPATSALLFQPNAVSTDGAGNLYIADSGDSKIREVFASNQTINTIAGIAMICGLSANSTEPGCGDGGPATSAALDFPRGVSVNPDGTILVTDTNNMRVRIIASGTNPNINNLAGGGPVGDGGPATSAILGDPAIVAVDGNENVFALETLGERLRRIDAKTNGITTVAGDGFGGGTINTTNGDGGPATSARFVNPFALARDAQGNFYIADPGAAVVRVINNQASPITIATVTVQPGQIATVAGQNGFFCIQSVATFPSCGDGGPATSANLLQPFGVAVDPSNGNIYISDDVLDTIRVVDNATGTISTFAGTPGTPCNSYTTTHCGDGGSPTSASLNTPLGLAATLSPCAGSTVVTVSDSGDNVIRQIGPGGGCSGLVISTAAFNGLPTFGGDGGPATSASMEGPSTVAVDELGDLFIGGGFDNVVRRVDAQAQTVITVAGDVDNLGGGFSGDGGPSTQALLGNFGVAVFKTAQGTHDIFIGDGSVRVRKVNLEPVMSNISPANGATLAFAPTLDGQVSDPQFISLSNTGLDGLIFPNPGPVVTGPFSAIFTSLSTAPGSDCIFTVTFAPVGTMTGTQTGTLTFTTNDPANPSFTYNLTGTASNSPATLSVTLSPAAGGTVTSDPSGITCPSTCGPVNFAGSSTVTLVAFPNPGFVFSGWSTGNAPGANCPGTNPCQVPMPASGGFSVVANFAAAPPPPNATVTITPLGSGTGTVTEPTTGINCTITNNAVSGACSATVAQGTQLKFTATATGTSVFAGWLSPCTGTAPCQFSLFFNQNVIPVFSAKAQPFAKGQVFLTLGNFVFVLDPSTGNIVQVLGGLVAGRDGQGMAFDSVGNLYVTNAGGDVQIYSNQAAGPTLLGPQVDANAGSVIVDPFGNIIVGYSLAPNTETPAVQEFAPGSGASSTPSAEFFPAYESTNEGSYWIELLDSSDTIAYTMDSNNGQGGRSGIKIFDLGEGIQHPDILPTLQGGDALFALRELPDESLLVAASDRILRMAQNGTISQSYLTDSGFDLQNLNLDPDGTSFWTDDQSSGALERINIASGNVISNFTTNLGQNFTGFFASIGGIAVFGQPASGGADLSITVTAPATATTGANLTYTITVTNNGPLNATGVTMTDPLPGGLSATATTGTGCSGTTTITCAIGALASGASSTITISVTPNATGTLTNTASVEGAQADPNLGNNSFTVNTTVNTSSPTLVSIAVTPANPSIAKGNTQQFTATGTFSDNSTQNLTNSATWGSATQSVATITAGGLATGVGTGTSTISATQGSISGSTVLTVTAPVLVSIAVTPANSAVFVAETEQFTAIGTLSDNSTQVLTATATWASSKTAVATINATGLATGVAGGTTTISATQSGVTGSTTLTVATGGTPPTFTTTTLPNGAIGAAYGQTLTVTGGTPPFTFSISSGSLPAGLNLGPTSGSIGGVPTGTTSTFTVNVVDSSSPTPLTGSATFTITINAADTSNNSELNGTYALLFGGFADANGTFDVAAGSFTADGNGHINGVVESSDASFGANGVDLFSGTYTLGADNRGTMTLTTETGTVVLAFSVGDIQSGVATKARFIRFDDTSGTGGHTGSGVILKQDPTAFTLAGIKGNYAFGDSGSNTSNGNPQSGVGFITADGNGNFTTGLSDLDGGGTITPSAAMSGTYASTANSASNGRFTANLTIAGVPGTFADSLYVVSSSTVLFISKNSTSNTVLSGSAQLQVPPTGGFGLGSVSGNSVFATQGRAAVAATSVEIGVANADGAGNFSIAFDQNKAGTPVTGTASGTYTVASNGRAVFTFTTSSVGATQPAIVYLDGVNQGFLAPTDGAASFGSLEPGGSGFTNATLSGKYFLGTLCPTENQVNDFSGVASFNGVSALQATTDESDPGGVLSGDSPFSTSYTVASNGRLTFTNEDGTQGVGYAASGCRVEIISNTHANPGIVPFECQVTPAVGPQVSFSSNAITFPSTPQGTTSAPIVVTLTNTGGSALVIGNVALTGANTADFSLLNPAGACQGDSSISPGLSCTINVTFTPASATTFNAAVTLTDNATGSPQTITLTGTGTTAGAVITITPSSTVNFGNQLVGTTSGAITTTVTNNGTQAITLTSVTLNPLPNTEAGTNPDGFTIVAGTGTCTNGTSLAANGGNCVLPVTFGPPATGAVSSTITLADSAGSQVITLNGTGIAPTISLNPTSLSFSTAPDTTSAAQTVTVTNSGAAPLHIANVALGGTDAADFAFVNGTTPCAKGTVVQPQATCTIGVDFTAPSQSTFNATVTVTSDASNGVQTIPLTGTGVVLSITPPPGGSTTATTNPGGKAVFPLILSSTGLTGNATLTCSSPQASITCAVVPGTVALTPNGVTHAAIVVDTFCARLSPPDSAPRSTPPTAPWLIAIVGLALLGSMALTKKRTLRLAMPLAVVLLMGILASSCGSPPKGPAGATPPGTYTLNITATVGQASSTISLTLIVQ